MLVMMLVLRHKRNKTGHSPVEGKSEILTTRLGTTLS